MVKSSDAKGFSTRFLELAVEFDSFVNREMAEEKESKISFDLLQHILKNQTKSQEEKQNEQRLTPKEDSNILSFSIQQNKNMMISPTTKEGEIVQSHPIIQYSDGTFRTVRKSGLLQYRFMVNGRQESVYGVTKEDCWQKRYKFAKTNTGYHKDTAPASKNPLVKEILNDKMRLSSYSAKARAFFESQIVTIESVTEETTYRDWASRWLLSKLPKIEPEYFSAIVGYLIIDIFPKWGRIKLKDFHMLELQDFINGIPMPNKRGKVAAVFSESLRFAKVNRILNYDPYEGLTYNKERKKLKGALSHRNQMLICCEIRHQKLFAFAMILLLTGMRPGEVLALSPSNFDFDKKEIEVTQSYSRYRKEIKGPKTNAGYRRVPFEDYLMQFVNPFLDTDGRIFEEFENDYISIYFSKTFKAAGIEGTAYIFRHTFVTNAYEIGVPPYVVQRWVGHSKQEQDDAYLALRDSREFIETPIVKYMRLLKNRVVAPGSRGPAKV